jgi:hypothetical protein
MSSDPDFVRFSLVVRSKFISISPMLESACLCLSLSGLGWVLLKSSAWSREHRPMAQVV